MGQTRAIHMRELSDDERNLLRHYSERDLSDIGRDPARFIAGQDIDDGPPAPGRALCYLIALGRQRKRQLMGDH